MIRIPRGVSINCRVDENIRSFYCQNIIITLSPPTVLSLRILFIVTLGFHMLCYNSIHVIIGINDKWTPIGLFFNGTSTSDSVLSRSTAHSRISCTESRKNLSSSLLSSHSVRRFYSFSSIYKIISSSSTSPSPRTSIVPESTLLSCTETRCWATILFSKSLTVFQVGWEVTCTPRGGKDARNRGKYYSKLICDSPCGAVCASTSTKTFNSSTSHRVEKRRSFISVATINVGVALYTDEAACSVDTSCVGKGAAEGVWGLAGVLLSM